jgi:hypothetical protein
MNERRRDRLLSRFHPLVHPHGTPCDTGGLYRELLGNDGNDDRILGPGGTADAAGFIGGVVGIGARLACAFARLVLHGPTGSHSSVQLRRRMANDEEHIVDVSSRNVAPAPRCDSIHRCSPE